MEHCAAAFESRDGEDDAIARESRCAQLGCRLIRRRRRRSEGERVCSPGTHTGASAQCLANLAACGETVAVGAALTLAPVTLAPTRSAPPLLFRAFATQRAFTPRPNFKIIDTDEERVALELRTRCALFAQARPRHAPSSLRRRTTARRATRRSRSPSRRHQPAASLARRVCRERLGRILRCSKASKTQSRGAIGVCVGCCGCCCRAELGAQPQYVSLSTRIPVVSSIRFGRS